MAIVLGLMSGTSMDGVDAVVCELGGGQTGVIKFLNHACLPYPKKLKNSLLDLMANGSTSDVCELNTQVGELFAKAALKAMLKLPVGAVQFIGSHGQTVFHNPKKRSTLQIGDPSVIATRTCLSVWSDFRSTDMANGGQGAPLAPALHLPLFGEEEQNVAVINIGGIANVTHIPAGCKKLSGVEAYDTGPGNMLMDYGAKRLGAGDIDKGGKIAKSGTVDEELLKRMLTHPFFKKRAPKSTGREEFGEPFVKWARLNRRRKWNEDTLATLTELTARSIANEIVKMDKRGRKTDKLVVCGGGAKNVFLLNRIQALLGNTTVVTSDSLGAPSQQIECGLMALLAFCGEQKVRLDLSSVTGSKNRSVLLGKKTPF